MSRASIYKKNKNVKKGLKNRRNGIMRKADTVHRTYGAQIAVLMEYGGRMFSYESSPHMLQNYSNDLAPEIQFGPGHFAADADGQGTPPSSSVASAPATAENSAEDSTEDGNDEDMEDGPSERSGGSLNAAGVADNGVSSEPEHRAPARHLLQTTIQHLAEMELLADNLFGD